MIISHRYRYLFIEVPHTASTAISHELRERYAGQPILHKHANYFEFLRQCRRDERSYFVFAAVRHPLDVLVTEYTKLHTNHRGAFTDPARRAEHGGWVDDDQQSRFRFVQTPEHTFSDYVGRYYDDIYHNWFLVGHDRFQRVMRYETIASAFQEVLEELNISPERELPMVNRSQRERDFSSYYDSRELRQRMAWICGPFMERWGFPFPRDWRPMRVPTWAKVRFALLESVIHGLGSITRLDPTSPSLKRVKQLYCLR